MLDVVRKEAEGCDCLQGFQAIAYRKLHIVAPRCVAGYTTSCSIIYGNVGENIFRTFILSYTRTCQSELERDLEILSRGLQPAADKSTLQ